MGAQQGKTAGLFNIMGQRLDDAPVPMLYVGPTKSNVDRVIEPQLTAMLRSVPELWANTDHSRKAQKLSKMVKGVSVRLAWAGSPTELASQPAHTVFVDEIDRMEAIPGEGDPVSLAEARTTNYAGGRIIITSTPTEGNVDVEKHPQTGIEHWKVSAPEDVLSAVWKLWQEGTRFEYAVPCPDCHEYFIPRLRWLKWPEKATPRVALREARLLCPNCGTLIDDSAKEAMNAAGQFLAPGQKVVDGEVVGDPPDADTASFWVSGLMSPWVTWGRRAANFISATRSGDQARIRASINLGFGELYSFKGEAIPADAVRKNCTASYKSGAVPADVRLLTCGVDTQVRKLVYSVRGWGYAMESWLIESGEIFGETDQPHVWSELAELLERTWGGRDDRPEGFRIRRMGIDSGYRPGDKWRRPDNVIYQFCRQYHRAVPTKGRDRLNKPLQPSLIDVTLRGVVYKQGLMLWHLDTDYWKSWLAARLTWPEDEPGRWWVPEDVTDDYCLQVTAESRVVKASGRPVWVRVRPENHFLDCEVINAAMAQSLGVHRRRKKKGKDDDKVPPPPTGAPPSMPPPPKPPTFKPPGPSRTSWIKRY
jgi:phage terminase large subunit GpA-like protein